ncbi:probable zinc metallo-protease [Ramularia collo-cygni]|uniref:CAAX prenyl protease n=1 Tax=Ramularia collo-cygni TaxID=112498 RepID=A0A2D3UVY0_9PEZI|nr:probable zinc metallo-protease [Ramularia collo-cygni]CZT18355.1 probable zinc metallo-protease [Ramularia collo-cygni]
MDLIRRLGAYLDSPTIPWKSLIITFSLGQYAIENYLAYRQYQVLRRTTVPRQLASEVDAPTHKKSQEYGRAKARFGAWSGAYNQLKNLLIISYDAYPKLWVWSGALVAAYAPARFSGEITHSLVFVFAYALAETIAGLPWSYYHHFVLEESFGFNKQTLSLWVSDLVKGQALTFAFGIPLGAAFLKIIQSTGEKFFLYIWLFMLAVQLGAISIFPTVITPLFNTLTPLPEGELRDRVHALSNKLAFPLSELQVIDGSKRSAHSNAYFTGLPFMNKKIVIYDTLIAKSSPAEVEAVLAHELGHWKMSHTAKLLGISSAHLLYIFTLFGVFINNKSLYEAFGFGGQLGQPIMIGFLLFNEVLSPTDSVVKLGMNVLTRKFEFEADAFSHQLGYAKELSAALIKLQIQNLSSMDADWLYSSYHYSHPILTERLKAVGWTSEKKISGEGQGVVVGGGEKSEL